MSMRHYFFDARTQGFFPDEYPDNVGPVTLYNYEAESPLSGVLFGGTDGYIRELNPLSPNDDGSTVTSEVVIGPTRSAGDQHRDGILLSLVGVMAFLTGDVTYEIKSGESAQETMRNSPVRTGTWSSGGMKLRIRPRVHAPSWAIRLKGTTLWSIELIKTQTIASGQQK